MKKKVLKIIQIVYDILSLGFIVFVSVAMAVAPKGEGRSYTPTIQVETKARSNYITTPTGYREYGTTDLFSYDFLRYLIDYYVNDLGVTSLSPDNTEMVNQYVLPSNNVYNLYYFENSDRSYRSITSVNNFVMSKALFGSGSASSAFPALEYSWVLSNSSPYDKQIGIRFCAQRTDNNRLTIWGVDLFFPTGSIVINGYTFNSVDLFYRILMLSENYNSGFNAFIGNIFNRSKNEQFSLGYDKGYDEGYDKAVTDVTNPDSTQYKYIYDLGKQEGLVEGMRGTETNAFIVIGQAFGAVGSILSIEVMPNLPLWVLVFTPLIIAVVIVVVKLIKG